MSNTRSWVLGAAALSILLAIAGWFLLISPERGKTADLHSQRAAQQSRNDQLRLDIVQLKAEFQTLPAKQAELTVIKRQLPSSPALPTLIRSLSSIATSSGVNLSSIAPGTPVAYTAPAVAATAAGTTPSTTAAAAPVAPAGLAVIPVTIVVSGTYAENELFLQQMQNSMTRAFLVQGLQIGAGSGTSTSGAATTTTSSTTEALTTTISGQIFVLQNTTAAASTATGTAAPATTGSAS